MVSQVSSDCGVSSLNRVHGPPRFGEVVSQVGVQQPAEVQPQLAQIAAVLEHLVSGFAHVVDELGRLVNENSENDHGDYDEDPSRDVQGTRVYHLFGSFLRMGRMTTSQIIQKAAEGPAARTA
jgi:hypothetical protein